MKFTGRCICGAVVYEADGEPVLQGNCHCRHCQRMTGSAYSANLFFPAPAVRVSGETRQFDHAGESGATVLVFCPACGTQVLSKPATMQGLVGIRAGTLDDPDRYEPRADIFTRSAVAWDCMKPDLPKFDTYPPMK